MLEAIDTTYHINKKDCMRWITSKVLRWPLYIMIWLAVTELLCPSWTWICSVCSNHNPTMEQEIPLFRSTSFHTCFSGIHVVQSSTSGVVVCACLFWLLYCMSLFNLQLLVTPLSVFDSSAIDFCWLVIDLSSASSISARSRTSAIIYIHT